MAFQILDSSKLIEVIPNIASTGNTLHFSLTGNDTTGNGSIAYPYRTAKKAVDEANLLASSINPILVVGDAGIYQEDPISLSNYVSITGLEQDRVVLTPNDVNSPLLSLTDYASASFLRIDGVTNEAGIYMYDAPVIAIAHKVYIVNSKYAVRVDSPTVDTYAYLEYVSADNISYIGLYATSSANVTEVSAENTYFYNITALSSLADVVSNGVNTKILYHTGSVVNQFSIGTGTGFLSTSGGSLRIRNCQIEGYNYGVLTNTGTSPDIVINSCTFDGNTYNFYINNVTATGYFQGYSDYSKYFINSSSSFFVSEKDNGVITVSKKGGDFTSVKSAVDSITDNSLTNRYIVRVGSGIFVEDTITMKPFVDIVGESFTNTIIEVDNANKHCIIASPNSGLFTLQVRGATGTGFSAIRHTGGAGVFRCLEVRFGANYNFYYQTSTNGTAVSIFQNCSAEATSSFTQAFEITDNGVNASTFAFNGFTYTGNGTNFIKAYGTLTSLSTANYTVAKTVQSGNGIHIYNGATASINAVSLINFNKALYNENTGSGVTLYTGAFSLRSNVTDIEILQPSSTGQIFGFFTKDKVIIDSNVSISLLFTDIAGGGTVSLGKFYIGDTYSTIFDAKDLITSGNMGLQDGGVITVGAGLSVDISAGHGFLGDYSGPDEVYKRIDWNSTNLPLSANSDVYIYFNSNGILTTNSSRPTVTSNIILGRVFTNATGVEFIDSDPNTGEHLANLLSNNLRDVFGALYVSGSLTTSNSSRQLQVTSGVYYLGENKFLPAGKSFTDNFTPLYRSAISGQWTLTTPTNTVLNSQYDDNSGTLASVTAGYYVKHNLFLVKDGIEKYYLLIGQEEHLLLADAQNAANPTPPSFFKDAVVRVASVITQQGNATFCQVADERPTPVFRGSGTLGVTNHGDLSGLADDGHPQYLLVAGTRPMSGNLDMGTNSITNVNLVDGVDVSAHASRHLPNGLDALATASAVSVSRLTSNSVGIANSFSRSDHTHQVVEDAGIVISTSGSATTLTTASNNRIIYNGNTFGESLVLGNATTYAVGKIIKVWNRSTQVISIQDNGLNEIFRIEPYWQADFALETNSTANGEWIAMATKPKFGESIEIYDDFIAPTTAGQDGWTATQNGAAAASAILAGLSNAYGIIQSTTGTSNSGRASLHKGGISILFGGGVSVLEMRVQIPTLSDVAQEYIAYFGYGDNTGAGDMVDGVYFEYNRLLSGDVWRLKTSSNSVRTTVVTASPVAASTWYKLRIEVNPAASRADFFVNGVNIGNVTTNIPTGTGRNTDLLLKIEKSAGGTARTILSDYVVLRSYLNR